MYFKGVFYVRKSGFSVIWIGALSVPYHQNHIKLECRSAVVKPKKMLFLFRTLSRYSDDGYKVVTYFVKKM